VADGESGEEKDGLRQEWKGETGSQSEAGTSRDEARHCKLQQSAAWRRHGGVVRQRKMNRISMSLRIQWLHVTVCNK